MVFSYMMLYQFDLPTKDNRIHWTEIYVIVTVSSALCEDIRKVNNEFVA